MQVNIIYVGNIKDKFLADAVAEYEKRLSAYCKEQNTERKESRVPEALTVCKEDVKAVLSSCGVSETHLSKFSVDFDEAFGYEADVHPKNIIDEKRLEIKLPDVSIKVAADRGDLIETRVIGGIKYILINAEENVEVNGVSIHIDDEKALPV